jgi:pimeloyl-ACP methyl ester carboxylesterase
MEHHQTTLLGSRLHYWIANPTKPATIMVVHGFRGTHHGLQDVMDGLLDYRLVVPDLPGFGQSTPMTEQPHTMTGYAKLIIALIDELKLPQVALLGHSMGTSVAAEVVVARPDLISRLILINPIAEPPDQGLTALKLLPGMWYQWLGTQVLPERLGQALLTHPMLIHIASAAMTKTRNPALRRRIHTTHKDYMIRYSDRHTLWEAYTASLKGAVSRHASQLQLPTLLIVGRQDDIAPLKGQRKLAAALPQAELVEIDGVGHLIHYEKPQEAAAAINDFLRRVGSGVLAPAGSRG